MNITETEGWLAYQVPPELVTRGELPIDIRIDGQVLGAATVSDVMLSIDYDSYR
jgi:hypothetical protein